MILCRGCRAAALLSALGLVACGGEDVLLGDGRSAAAGNQDVPTFSRIAVVSAISTPGTVDDDPSLTGDLLQLYFDSKRDGGVGQEDIWRSARSTATGSWDPPVPVPELNSAERETGIALSGDGLTIWFSSNRPESTGGLDVFVATRATVTDSWSAVERVAELSSGDDDLVSAVDASATTLYLARRADENSDYDVYVSQRAGGSASWDPPRPVQELNTTGEESDAFPVEHDRALLFTRSEDLVLARRSEGSEAYGTPSPLPSLNSPDDDRDPWATDDLSYVVFSSNRSGDYLLYEAWR